MWLFSRITVLLATVTLAAAPVAYSHGFDDHGDAGSFEDDSTVYDGELGSYDPEIEDLPRGSDAYDSRDWEPADGEPCHDSESWPRLHEGRYRF